MTVEQIKDKLLVAGVKNLKEWGYPAVTEENILTDEVYSGFFKVMLLDNMGNGKQIDIAINELLLKIKP